MTKAELEAERRDLVHELRLAIQSHEQVMRQLIRIRAVVLEQEEQIKDLAVELNGTSPRFQRRFREGFYRGALARMHAEIMKV